MDPLKIISILLGVILICILVYLITRQVKDYFSTRNPLLRELFDKIRNALKNNEENLCLSKDGECKLENQITNKGGLSCLDNITIHESDSSYTINKQKIHLCLRDENNKYYEKNMLIYVLAHEIAHVLCDSVGHTEEWKQIFDNLLDCLAKEKIFDPEKPLIKNYCGHN